MQKQKQEQTQKHQSDCGADALPQLVASRDSFAKDAATRAAVLAATLQTQHDALESDALQLAKWRTAAKGLIVACSAVRALLPPSARGVAAAAAAAAAVQQEQQEQQEQQDDSDIEAEGGGATTTSSSSSSSSSSSKSEAKKKMCAEAVSVSSKNNKSDNKSSNTVMQQQHDDYDDDDDDDDVDTDDEAIGVFALERSSSSSSNSSTAVVEAPFAAAASAFNAWYTQQARLQSASNKVLRHAKGFGRASSRARADTAALRVACAKLSARVCARASALAVALGAHVSRLLRRAPRAARCVIAKVDRLSASIFDEQSAISDAMRELRRTERDMTAVLRESARRDALVKQYAALTKKRRKLQKQVARDAEDCNDADDDDDDDDGVLEHKACADKLRASEHALQAWSDAKLGTLRAARLQLFRMARLLPEVLCLCKGLDPLRGTVASDLVVFRCVAEAYEQLTPLKTAERKDDNDEDRVVIYKAWRKPTSSVAEQQQQQATAAAAAVSENKGDSGACASDAESAGAWCVLKQYRMEAHGKSGGGKQQRDCVLVRKRLRKSANIMSRLRHDGVLSLDAVVADYSAATGSTLYLESPFVAGASLHDVLKSGCWGTANDDDDDEKKEGAKIKQQQQQRQSSMSPAALEQSKLRVLAKIFAALDYVHRNGVVHGDLTPSNIMLEEHVQLGQCVYTPVLIDFDDGKDTKLASLGTRTVVTVQGKTRPFTAPEVDENGCDKTTASDLFAFGLVCCHVFGAVNANMTTGKRTADTLQAKRLPLAVRALVRKLLLTDPAARPSASDVAVCFAKFAASPTVAIASAMSPAMAMSSVSSKTATTAAAAPWAPQLELVQGALRGAQLDAVRNANDAKRSSVFRISLALKKVLPAGAGVAVDAKGNGDGGGDDDDDDEFDVTFRAADIVRAVACAVSKENGGKDLKDVVRVAQGGAVSNEKSEGKELGAAGNACFVATAALQCPPQLLLPWQVVISRRQHVANDDTTGSVGKARLLYANLWHQAFQGGGNGGGGGGDCLPLTAANAASRAADFSMGVLTAKCLLDGYPVTNLRGSTGWPTAILKFLLGSVESLTMDDYGEEFGREAQRALQTLLFASCQQDVDAALAHLTVARKTQIKTALTTTTTAEAKQSIRVRDVERFVVNTMHADLIASRQAQLRALKAGFDLVLPCRKFVRVLNSAQLRVLMSGQLPVAGARLLRMVQFHSGKSSSSSSKSIIGALQLRVQRVFASYVSGLSSTSLRLLLLFLTHNSNLPVNAKPGYICVYALSDAEAKSHRALVQRQWRRTVLPVANRAERTLRLVASRYAAARAGTEEAAVALLRKDIDAAMKEKLSTVASKAMGDAALLADDVLPHSLGRTVAVCAMCLVDPGTCLLSRGNCTHKFCADCTSTFLDRKTAVSASKRFPMTCPSCRKGEEDDDVTSSSVNEKSLRALVDAKVIDQATMDWVAQQQTLCTLPEAQRTTCPKCELLQLRQDEKHVAITCGSCGHAYCYAHGDRHTGQTCAQFELEIKGEDDATTKLLDETTRKCPSCGLRCELKSGCNHITCPTSNCGTHFCYVCAEPHAYTTAAQVYAHMQEAHGGYYN
jgi:serine/threonine protein kinase/RNase P subunit RPR2